jgi:hypothetical protein
MMLAALLFAAAALVPSAGTALAPSAAVAVAQPPEASRITARLS